ncbi:hypothetical protein [Staphylococcus hyicus]|uniref:hypothetical protein n=1 Tax=Staphylococcus hyicus TaxID=1284 RepID=UPI002A8049C9|nr:hypothetical protein [Staphylococcus hyicus]MDY3696926.1 hypothetical protein [Staphylococcus hyicus]
MIKFIKLNWAYFLVGAIGGVIAVVLILLLQHAMNWVESLKIIISILALFCTFLGAYLGAMISGDNALKLQKREIKQNYLIKNYKMLISLDEKGLKDVKNNLKKYNDKLLKNEEQPYGTFSELYKCMNEIEKIKNDVEFTDSYTKAKFDMASDYITDIKGKNEIIKLIEIEKNRGNRRDKEQATKDLNKGKECMHTMVKKIQKSLEDVPLVDINEKFQL